MSDIDPNAAEKLIESSLNLLNKQGKRFPGMHAVLAGLKQMGEDTSEQEASLDELEKVFKSVQKLVKRFPVPKQE